MPLSLALERTPQVHSEPPREFRDTRSQNLAPKNTEFVGSRWPKRVYNRGDWFSGLELFLRWLAFHLGGIVLGAPAARRP